MMENSKENLLQLFRLRLYHLEKDMARTANVQSRAILHQEYCTIRTIILCMEDEQYFNFVYKIEQTKDEE